MWTSVCQYIQGTTRRNGNGTSSELYKRTKDSMVMWRINEDDISRIEWKPTGKRPRGRPIKRWLDLVEEAL